MEEQSGVVYWLDPTTVGMEYEDVLAVIPDVASVTSVFHSGWARLRHSALAYWSTLP